MATSGSSIWSLQRDAVINAALRKLVVLAGGSSPETYQVTDAAQALNAMIKGFQADGMPVWAINKYTFSTVAGLATYTIGVGQTLNTPMPLKIVQAFQTGTGGQNVPLEIRTMYDFALLPQNNTSGTPVHLYYQPSTTTGQMHFWPTPLDSTTSIDIFYQRPFQDMVSATDDFDFPPYWTEALIFGLAWRLAPEYGVPLQDRGSLKNDAEYFHAMALSFGEEEGSLTLMPDWSGKR